MRIVSLVNDAQIIDRILRHVGMWVSEVWNNGVRIAPSTRPPVGESVELQETAPRRVRRSRMRHTDARYLPSSTAQLR